MRSEEVGGASFFRCGQGGTAAVEKVGQRSGQGRQSFTVVSGAGDVTQVHFFSSARYHFRPGASGGRGMLKHTFVTPFAHISDDLF